MPRAFCQVLVLACVTVVAKHQRRHPPSPSKRGILPGPLSKESPRSPTVAAQEAIEVELSAISNKLEARRLSTPKKQVRRWCMALSGVLIGVVLFQVFMYFGSRVKVSSLAEESMSEGGLDQGLVQVRPVFFGGAFFKQFSWCPESDLGRSLRIHDVQGRQVALASGALIRSADSDSTEVADDLEYDCRGELCLLVGTSVWATLRLNEDPGNAATSWPSFKILTAQGTIYAEVKLLSDAKCIVEGPPPLKRRLMTVVGNFCHNEFFCGDRNIHVWIAQAGTERTRVGAQCETRTETLRTNGGSRRARSYFVSTTGHADTPLVMAVMLGLQEIHTMTVLRQRQQGVAESAEVLDGGGDMNEMVSA